MADSDPELEYEESILKAKASIMARSWSDPNDAHCFWAVSELEMLLRELARRLEMSPAGVGFSVEGGESIARENGLQLIE